MNQASQFKANFLELDWVKVSSPENHPLGYRWNGFKPETKVLSKGHVKEEGYRPLRNDILYQRDVSVQMRDGTTIYTDVFRPTKSDEDKVPGIIAYSPYGKSGTGIYTYDLMGPYRCGVPKDTTSGYDKFEGPDPDEWCGRGYAIINPDARGAGASEGDIHFWGIQEAEDVHDLIEWISTQTWCNGSVAMMGNSWLAVSQLNYASRDLNHPALKAIAPWEAMADVYNDFVLRGGFEYTPLFMDLILKGFAGSNYVEDMPGMIRKHPLFDAYWADKSFDVANIDQVAMYVAASYSSNIHNRGSHEVFEKARTPKKWLRTHPMQEWSDLHRPDVNDDLQLFFDCFCKGIDNGFDRNTPPVRVSLLGFEGSNVKTIRERAETEYPIARQQLTTFYLDTWKRSLSKSKPTEESSASYAGHHLTETLDFTMHFDSPTEIVGYPTVRLWMSCPEHNDMDIIVQIRKISVNGELLEHLNYPCPDSVENVPDTNVVKCLGPVGALRASHSVSKEAPQDGDHRVRYRHDQREPIEPGTIVPLEITLWPMGMVFGEGEGIMLRVAGHQLAHPEVALVKPEEPIDANMGTHIVHTGGKYDSYLILPIIPQAGS